MSDEDEDVDFSVRAPDIDSSLGTKIFLCLAVFVLFFNSDFTVLYGYLIFHFIFIIHTNL